MKREIKFRGKRPDGGEWAYGSLIKYHNPYIEGSTRTFIAPHDIEYHQQVTLTQKHRIEVPSYIVDSSTVGQFTGLQDRNGKEIYEGDIFVSRGLLCTSVVEWEKEGRFLGFTIGGERKITYINREPRVEVVGNIHENTELLVTP